MKVGDIVRYRDWLATDGPIDAIAEWRRCWGDTGIVISVCEDTFKNGAKEPAVDYYNQDGELCRARKEDLKVLREMKIPSKKTTMYRETL